MADSPVPDPAGTLRPSPTEGQGESRLYSLAELLHLFHRRRLFLTGTIVGLSLLCLLYCWIAPNQYEATARVALRMQPVSSLTVDAAETMAPASILSTPLQLETLVNVLRSEQLAWHVLTQLKLYRSPAFTPTFSARFPGFDPQHPTPESQEYLLKAFAKRLQVRTMPRTLMIEIRFRSRDPALAANVVNALIRGFQAQESESRTDATASASSWLGAQLKVLTAEVEGKEQRLAEFERAHGLMSSQQTLADGQSVETLHDPAMQQIDEVGRLLAAASGERILREALYREAQAGNPEQVLAANPELQAEMGPGGAALVQQLRTHLSDVSVELAQLQAEHGPNYPRVVELERAETEIGQQIKSEDANLVEAFSRTWKAAAGREGMLQAQLDGRVAQGLKQNDATIQYSVLHAEVLAGRALCSRLRQRIDEAALSAGVHASSITVVDWAREPFRPSSPDLWLYLSVTFFASLWVALVGALLLDAVKPVIFRIKELTLCLAMLLACTLASAQAPTPNTSGLPSGVVKLPADAPSGVTPNAREAPPVWNAAAPALPPALAEPGVRVPGASMALPIAAGDFLEVSEFHLPEFRSSVRVAADGTVTLPLIGPVRVLALTEQAASALVEKALFDQGMLLHPHVSVLVTSAVGQDVSVLGEVARPGVYPYTVHHRLLDLISAASGLGPNAGRLVTIFHRADERVGHPYVLDPGGTDSKSDAKSESKPESKPDAKVDHNPQLDPGDTVQVSRAGLVYVIGDVVRPGGFAVDPVQGLTVVQALSLAWGATPNASVGKAILIRDQPGGRTLTTLNLRRMIRGQDPDQPVRDRDILFVPDSTTKNLLNKSLESAIQSAIGVSIYAGLVYSQRF